MQIELTVDQVDEVLIAELQRTYRDDIASPKQLKAIRRVLKYYMAPNDYVDFMDPPAPVVEPLQVYPCRISWGRGRSFQVGDVVMVNDSYTGTVHEDVITMDDGSEDDQCPYWTGEIGDYPGRYCHYTKDLTLIRHAT